MKQTVLLIAAIFSMALVCNATNDTVTVIDQPGQVIITETPTGVKVDVVGSKDNAQRIYTYTVEHDADDKVTSSQNDNDWEIRFPFTQKGPSHGGGFISKKSPHSHWGIIMDGLYLGGGVHNSWGTFEIGVLNGVGVNYDSHHGQNISLGLGFSFKAISPTKTIMLVCDDMTKVVSVVPFPESVESKGNWSNLHMASLQFPLMFRQKIYKRLAIRFGGIMNWNYLAQVNTHYKIGNDDHNITEWGLKQNQITFDVMGGLSLSTRSVGGAGIYCRYSPSQVFKKGYGPEIKDTWTVGVCIGF